ncbi:TraU family protein [Escherichia coli]|nr:TraU family protein [Escherichia coli]
MGWVVFFPLCEGSDKVKQGKVPDLASPSIPIQICPAPPPLFRRIGLAIGYWEPLALPDVPRPPGCRGTRGFTLRPFGKRPRGRRKREEMRQQGGFEDVPW